MKLLILSLCAMGIGFTAALAQTNAPAAIDTNATVQPAVVAPAPEPTSSTTPDNTRYIKAPDLLARCQARLSAINGKPCNIIFIGDSITEGWLSAGKAVWDKTYAPRHALNFGISGDKTQNVLWRLNNMDIQSLKPKVAVILIGTNNVANTPHEIADGVKAVIANTQSAFPGVKIILVSIMPNDRAEDKMMEANSLIKGLADDTSTFYLNMVTVMPAVTTNNPDGTTNTNYKGLSKDRLHPDASGYQLWADTMEPLLTKLLAGGK